MRAGTRIREQGALTIAVSDVPYYVRRLRELLPRAMIQVHDGGIEPLFDRAAAHADALALPAERGSAWTLMYPAYSVVVPGPGADPGAAGVSDRPSTIRRLAAFVNTWIALKRKDGTIDAAYEHWILGQDAAPRQPRWSIVRNVLHWVE